MAAGGIEAERIDARLAGDEFDYFRIQREVTDALQRAADGRLQPRYVPLSDVEVPATGLAVAATRLAQAELPPPIFAHCMRSYYFGMMIGEVALSGGPGKGWDAETFYLASMLHDLKCTPAAFRQSHASFELHGGASARTFLADVAGAPPRVADTVMEAICRHKDTDPSSHGFSPEAQLLRFGAQLDALGNYAALIHPRSVADVVAAFPRAGFNHLFADTLLEEVRVKRFCTSVVLLLPAGVQTQIRRNPVMKEFDGWE